MYDVLQLVKFEDDLAVVEPGVIYPATIARIKEVLEGAEPTELIPPGGKMNYAVEHEFLYQARIIDPRDWNLALVSFDATDPFTRELRAEVLAFCDAWWKCALWNATHNVSIQKSFWKRILAKITGITGGGSEPVKNTGRRFTSIHVKKDLSYRR